MPLANTLLLFRLAPFAAPTRIHRSTIFLRAHSRDEAAAGEEEDEGDDYVVGSFGEPMDEFYADEDGAAGGGGWGDAAMDRMSDFISSSSGSDERGRRD